MKQRADLTFKHNRHHGRHGWLRLTPAYSVKLVEQILSHLEPGQRVLDPFSGTGTTGVVSASAGYRCELFDINPLLVWLATAKTRNYSESERKEARTVARKIVCSASGRNREAWTPPIKDIERWWAPGRLRTLAAIFEAIERHAESGAQNATDLLKIAFCRVMMDWSNAAFNHQSMSFKDSDQTPLTFDDEPEILASFGAVAERIVSDVEEPLRGSARCQLGDSRELASADEDSFSALITSPPYPNRMSYIRELRPYMYWLGYIQEAKEAGELDWQAIGGTWGCATSRVGQWTPLGLFDEGDPLIGIVRRIAVNSPLLANYVHKYFEDMVAHFKAAARVVRPGGHIFYIVGNSKFYDTILPVEELFAALMRRSGFGGVHIDAIRKRNSKKELFEYVVSGTAGGCDTPRVPWTDRRTSETAALASLPFEA